MRAKIRIVECGVEEPSSKGHHSCQDARPSRHVVLRRGRTAVLRGLDAFRSSHGAEIAAGALLQPLLAASRGHRPPVMGAGPASWFLLFQDRLT